MAKRPECLDWRKQPWHKFIESEEGKSLADLSTLTAQQYLENRLWRAFHAGMEAQRDLGTKSAG